MLINSKKFNDLIILTWKNSLKMPFNSYSKALYELSIESYVTDEIEHQSKSILKALETIKEFNAFIKNPLFKQADQTEMLNTFIKEFNLNVILGKFLKFLVSKRRLFYLDKILKDFILYCSFKRGEIEAKLISAKELQDDEVEQIKKELFAKFGSKINLDYKVDKDLISGLIIQVGSIMIDNSIKNKLKQIKSQMIEV